MQDAASPSKSPIPTKSQLDVPSCFPGAQLRPDFMLATNELLHKAHSQAMKHPQH